VAKRCVLRLWLPLTTNRKPYPGFWGPHFGDLCTYMTHEAEIAHAHCYGQELHSHVKTCPLRDACIVHFSQDEYPECDLMPFKNARAGASQTNE